MDLHNVVLVIGSNSGGALRSAVYGALRSAVGEAEVGKYGQLGGPKRQRQGVK